MPGMDSPGSTKRIVRPRAAASLILVRNGSRGPEILLGRRPRGAVFMPGVFVFPGGRVSREDPHIRPASLLDPHLIPFMAVAGDAGRAQTLAMTAVRETFEETGLLLAQAGDPGRATSASWSAFRERGLAPALARLHYIGRAITPTSSTLRFHPRFFGRMPPTYKALCVATGNLKNCTGGLCNRSSGCRWRRSRARFWRRHAITC